MSVEFLGVDQARRSERFTPVARSPMERLARAAGARFEPRDGWIVAVSYDLAEQEAVLGRVAGWVDVSHLGKLELQAAPEDLGAICLEASGGEGLELGRATRAAAAWWCPLTQARLLVVCEPSGLGSLRERLEDLTAVAERPVSVVDVTSAFAALTLAGPLAREAFARFCAIDLRPQTTPVGAVRPGSIARQPGIVVREAEDRFLMLFGWAVAEYMWSQVEDAVRHLGGAPVGLDALAPLEQQAPDMPSHA